MNEELLAGILRSPRLPTPPSVALQVIDLVQDPSVSTVALASTIGADPALAGVGTSAGVAKAGISIPVSDQLLSSVTDPVRP